MTGIDYLFFVFAALAVLFIGAALEKVKSKQKDLEREIILHKKRMDKAGLEL